MDTDDWYNGFGELFDNNGNLINANFILPTVGDSYIDYYFLPNLAGTYWADVVLNDASEDRKAAKDVGAILGNNGWDLGRKTLLTFTWTNTGLKDVVTPGDESAMKFELETNVQLEQTDLVIRNIDGVVKLASHLWFTEKDPDIIFYFTDDDGNPDSTNQGPYDGNTTAWQRYHRENNESPAHEVYTTNTILTITAYSKFNFTFLMADHVNSVNDRDFYIQPYNERNARLASKNKKPTDGANDLLTVIDTGRWRFHDYTHTESASQIHKYSMVFHYQPTKWNEWYGSTTDEYPEIDLYDTLIKPFYNT
jgi:hypothetical protein